MKFSGIEIALNPEKEIPEETVQNFQNALFRLKNHEPIQYIVGETDFFGLPFKVNQHTLIPRPETEELVEWILSETPPLKGVGGMFLNQQLLDIGTGSGCIAISLAKNLPNSKISALDISENALEVARENAEINNIEVDFFQADILKEKSLPKQFDIIVSNPPYVRNLEKGMMQQNVLEHEPETALFVADGDPLVFYRAISKLAKKHLKPKGKLFFEINEYLGEEMKSLLKSEGFRNIEVKKDIFGKDRMLKCNI